ncbi:SDR family oxidoreductase [Microbacterium sp.]|uniref:SDR family oxidoreductase n=1 Tax=Microbacterium sp. TaxID=51671 RepID=UPI002810FBA1|nr:SDR family oxidoreductase [Microbacterium sp.]
MRIVVVGGTGLIGARVVTRLRGLGHDAMAAARATGVDSFTADGLEAALDGAQTLIDVSNSSYFDEAGAEEFFYTSTLNLLTYGAAAGVSHHVVLSVVGTDRLARSEGGYFRAKAAQERLVVESGRAYSFVHATQFYEFVRSIIEEATREGVTRVADALFQPMAADDVAAAVVATALGDPVNGVGEFAGPEVFSLQEMAKRELRLRDDDREVTADPLGTYFGARLERRELLPGPGATLSTQTFHDWRVANG